MIKAYKYIGRFSDLTKLCYRTKSTESALSVCRQLNLKEKVKAGDPRQSETGIRVQYFDYFLIIDFEATCDQHDRPSPQEIIEFPVLKVNGCNFETEAVFHQYVQPVVNRELTPFCTQLTGIIQEMVDGQPDLRDTLKAFDDWMLKEGLLADSVQSIFVSCGDWDLKTMLPSQCDYCDISYPDYLKKWINIKQPFSDVMGTYTKGLIPMLTELNLEHHGQLHSGIDDCVNIAQVVNAIAKRGYAYRMTGHVKDKTML